MMALHLGHLASSLVVQRRTSPSWSWLAQLRSCTPNAFAYLFGPLLELVESAFQLKARFDSVLLRGFHADSLPCSQLVLLPASKHPLSSAIKYEHRLRTYLFCHFDISCLILPNLYWYLIYLGLIIQNFNCRLARRRAVFKLLYLILTFLVQ